MRFSTRTLALSLTLAATAALTACGSSDSLDLKLAQSNVVKTLNPTDGPKALPALQAASTGFAFANGVPDFGTTTATTVTIGGTSAAPTFKAKTGSQEATGDFSFGSCIFKFNQAFGKAAAGTTVTISSCSFTLNTMGAPANGTAQAIGAVLNLNGTTGTSTVQTVISGDGTVQVGGSTIGNVPTATTGATGAK